MRYAVVLALALAAPLARCEEVSVRTLLPQMTDLNRLARKASPSFTAAQSSSYDRHSDPGPSQDPFANGDAGYFLRTEKVNGQEEQVMADLKGPGTVVRIWSANPQSDLRFYFDGETTPRFTAKMADLLTGKVAPFGAPFGYMASQGTQLYFPFPYAKSLKITTSGTRGLYYHVNYRTYQPGTKVKTFNPAELPSLQTDINRAAAALDQHNPTPSDYTEEAGTPTIEPSKSAELQMGRGPRQITELVFNVPAQLSRMTLTKWDDPLQPHNYLRKLILSVSFDGETTIKAPLGDFYSTGPGINVVNTLPFSVDKDGRMICRLVMPYKKSATVRIENKNPFAVRLSFYANTAPIKWTNDTYYLHAQWTADHGSTRPFRDMHLLDVKGEGLYLGTNLMVSNPVRGWWGEGDEKAYVDGESFASTFGTGTEDYFGYAWSSGEIFQHPYNAQVYCDHPINRGHSFVARYHLFDPIPFTQSLKFDLEMWHWNEVIATFTHTTYWYAEPGTTAPVDIDESQLLPPFIEAPQPVKGALEAETFEVVSISGGTTERQSGFEDLSNGEQRWWLDPKEGDKLVLKVPVAQSGRYEVIGAFCHARDYGIHKLTLGGKDAGQYDFFGDGVQWKKISLGTFDLNAGTTLLEVECKGHHAGAEPRNMFGLDYLLLVRK